MSNVASGTSRLWSRKLPLAALVLAGAGYYQQFGERLGHAPTVGAGARLWVDRLSQADFEEALGRLHTYPAEYRRHLLTRASPQARSLAWRQALLSFRTEYPISYGRSAERDEVIADALEFVSSGALSGAASDEQKAKGLALVERFTKAFGKAAAARIVAVPCGGEDAGAGLPLLERAAFHLRKTAGPTAMALASLSFAVPVHADFPDCECSVENTWCNWPQQVTECKVDACVTSTWGCGNWGFYQCNGMCS